MGSIFHSTAGKPKCFPTEARETPARSFFSHKMKKCAGDSFCAAGHFSFWVSGWRRVFLGRQQEPPRAPAVGREETRSPPILQAPFLATDKKEIYRLFSALPGNNRSQREVFLVQPRLRWRKLRHLAAPSVEKPILSFFPNLALLSQNVQSGWFFHFETGFSVKLWISLPQDERMGSIFHSMAGKTWFSPD